MNAQSEELYLEAENAIKNNDFVSAKRNFEEILQDDPTNACTHNSLGWLYKTQFDDYKTAENHYRAAIRYAPDYPHAYWNLVYLLTDLERWDELKDLLNQCIKIPTIDKSLVYCRLGIMDELKEQFEKAIKHYQKGILLCINDERLEELKKNMDRCEFKMTLLA